MATLLSLRSRILRILGDPEGTGYSDDLLFDAISAAFDGILPWVPKTGQTTITGDGATTVFALPAYMYEIEAVVSLDTGEILPKAVLVPGVYRGEKLEGTNDWILYPTGSITFSKALASGSVYEIFYLAEWTKPNEDTELSTVLEPPAYLTTAISLYAAAYALLPAAVGVAEVGPWKSKPDLGTPEHNPLQKAATFLLTCFQQEISRHPRHQKSQR